MSKETRTNPRSTARNQSVELTFLKYLPGRSVVHRMWAGTKIVCLVLIGIGFAVSPSWGSLAIGAVLVLIGFMAARLPLGVLPRLPSWFWLVIGLTGFISFLAGGDPSIEVGNAAIGLDGLLTWLRLTLITVVTLMAAGILGWTTQLGELGPALARLGSPLRWFRVPVDELVAVVAIAARCFPLIIDDVRTLIAAWRIRSPELPITLRGRITYVHDLLVTALVSAVRRAREMGQAIQARGSTSVPDVARRQVGFADFAAMMLALAGAVAMIVV